VALSHAIWKIGRAQAWRWRPSASWTRPWAEIKAHADVIRAMLKGVDLKGETDDVRTVLAMLGNSVGTSCRTVAGTLNLKSSMFPLAWRRCTLSGVVAAKVTTVGNESRQRDV